ncbi:MAG TPA: flavin reductase family protein [Anaerolineales bacterium]|nr:flavin reductase family protein [Anaerolineales bacterium]
MSRLVLQPDRDLRRKEICGSEIAALLNPRLAVLVSCCDLTGKPNILSVAWHSPLSHKPPLVGIAIHPRRYSHDLIRAGQEFIVNVVGMAFEDAVQICGSYSGASTDKAKLAGLSFSPARTVRPPYLTNALGHLECRVWGEVPVGDHTLFIGQVQFAEALEACFDACWDPSKADVLLCLQRDRLVTLGGGKSLPQGSGSAAEDATWDLEELICQP